VYECFGVVSVLASNIILEHAYLYDAVVIVDFENHAITIMLQKIIVELQQLYYGSLKGYCTFRLISIARRECQPMGSAPRFSPTPWRLLVP